MRKFYGFTLLGNIKTTWGEPNERTGRMSIAGHVAIFDRVEDRDAWQDGYKNLVVTKVQLRHFCRGMTMTDYNEMLNYMQGV